MKRFQNILTILVFCVMIALPILFIDFHAEKKYSESEKRYLAGQPTIIMDDGSLNPEAVDEIQDWINDNIGFRSELVEMTADINYSLLNRTTSDSVHLGKDHWLYYTLDNNLAISTGDFAITNETLEKILCSLLTVQGFLRERGTEFVLVLPPSKVSVYPENMRYGYERVIQTPDDIVADYLRKNSDLKIVTVKDILLDAKSDAQVYFKTDTHWNERGAYIGYQEIINKLNEWFGYGEQPVSVTFSSDGWLGDLTKMLGRMSQENTEVSSINDPTAEKLDKNSNRQQVIKNIIGNNITTYSFENTKTCGRRALVFGDSFFGSWNVTELLSEHFDELTFIWNFNISKELIDETNPDIVIFEVTERGIKALQNIGTPSIWGKDNYTLLPISEENVIRSNGVEISENSDGSMSYTITDAFDPGVVFQTLPEPCAIREIDIVFQDVSETQKLQLFYSTEGSFTENNSCTFTIVPWQRVYKLQNFQIDMIQSIRLDFDNIENVIYQIKEIRLLCEKETMDAEPNRFTFVIHNGEIAKRLFYNFSTSPIAVGNIEDQTITQSWTVKEDSSIAGFTVFLATYMVSDYNATLDYSLLDQDENVMIKQTISLKIDDNSYQQIYFDTPLSVQKGQKITISMTFDNTCDLPLTAYATQNDSYPYGEFGVNGIDWPGKDLVFALILDENSDAQ